MSILTPIKPSKRARVGLYSIGLHKYWEQFPDLLERVTNYGKFIENKMAEYGEVHYFGLVDTEGKAREAGEWFNARNVDIIFCHVASYATSATSLPVHQICKKPVVVLNLQPTAQINYKRTTTSEWLANEISCCVPELSNAYNRAGIPFRVVNGLLGLDYTPAVSLSDENTKDRPEAIEAWKEISEWIRSASVVRTLQHSRFGFLGNTYGGMLDMYSDFTMIQAQTGVHVQVLEMCDLDKLFRGVTPQQVNAKLEEVRDMFVISEDSPADPIAKKPTEEQLLWSCRVAVAQEQLVREYDLDSLTYYYEGEDNDYEKLQAGFILGHSLLTARGIPCAGEGDLKTALAMKIADILETGGSYSEIAVIDYVNGTILLGHDGPFHIAISDQKPILRGMGIYHGKQGSGISVEAKVAVGPVTTLGVTQTGDGKLKMIVSEGLSTDGEIMQIGNTQTPVKFAKHPNAYLSDWFAEAPTHHCALTVGHNASLFTKVAALMACNNVVL